MSIKLFSRKIIVVTAFLVLTAVPAFCEEFGKFGIGSRFYNFETSTAGMGEVDIALDSAYPLDLNFTYRFYENFSLEFSVATFTQEVEARLDDERADIGDMTQTPLSLSLRYEQQVHESDLYIYFGLGGSYFINEFDYKKRSCPASFFGANYDSVEVDNSLSFNMNIGAEYRFMENYAFCTDIRMIMNKNSFDIRYADGSIKNEDVGQTSSMIGLGLKYYF